MRRPGHVAVVVILAALVGAFSGCGSEGSGSAVTTDATVIQGAAASPLRVALVGDSVAHNLEAPLRAALGRSGQLRYVGLLTMPRNGEQGLWRTTLRDFDPDVVVVLMGTWEIDKVLTEPDFPASYVQGVVNPFINQTLTSGAEIVWLAMPTSNSPRSEIMRNLDEVYADTLAHHPEHTTFVDPDEVLLDAEGRWTQTLPGADGRPESLRGDDGAHLCPAGAVRVVGQVLGEVGPRWDVTAPPDWQHGLWRTEPPEPWPAICAES